MAAMRTVLTPKPSMDSERKSKLSKTYEETHPFETFVAKNWKRYGMVGLVFRATIIFWWPVTISALCLTCCFTKAGFNSWGAMVWLLMVYMPLYLVIGGMLWNCFALMRRPNFTRMAVAAGKWIVVPFKWLYNGSE